MNLTIPVKIEFSDLARRNCLEHPTCEGCPFCLTGIGCYFRQGRTPREWPDFEEIFERMKIND